MDSIYVPFIKLLKTMDSIYGPFIKSIFLLTINQFELPTIYQMTCYYQLVKPIELPIGKNIVQG
jgi:hypothetical protein